MPSPTYVLRTGDGTTTAFVMPTVPDPTTLLVFRNGQLQTINGDYSFSGMSITFFAAPLNGDALEFYYAVVSPPGPPSTGLDLTTLANVKSWLASGSGTSDDQTIQDCITAFSIYVLRITGRGPADGSQPANSPFVEPINYNEWYDGPGGTRLMLRNWPIITVSSVTVDTVTIPQSTAPNIPGWVIDGTAKSLSMRGNGNAGFVNGSLVVGFQNLRSFARGFVFSDSQPQNVNVQYTAGFTSVPFDLEMAARKTVALNYKRRSWIGQKSQAMAAGAGTVVYGTWEYDDDVRCVLRYYQRTASGL